jgi:hypothetical protein
VTTIISNTLPVPERLAAWKISSGKNGVEKMKASQIIGTLAHYRILNKLSPSTLEPPNFKPDELPVGAMEKVDTCEIMWDELNLDIGYPRKIERLMFDNEYTYSGTPDLVAPIGGMYTLADLKTSKEIYETHCIQMGGYDQLLGSAPERAMLISIHPNTFGNTYLRAHTHEISRKDLDSYRDQFLDLTKEFHRKHIIEQLVKEHGIIPNSKQVIGCD